MTPPDEHDTGGETESFSPILPDDVEHLVQRVLEKAKAADDVARAMAEGALANSRADVAVSTTGVADEGDEPGLVHFACAVRGGPTTHREERFGAIGRGPVRIASMRVALTMLDEVL